MCIWKKRETEPSRDKVDIKTFFIWTGFIKENNNKIWSDVARHRGPGQASNTEVKCNLSSANLTSKFKFNLESMSTDYTILGWDSTRKWPQEDSIEQLLCWERNRSDLIKNKHDFFFSLIFSYSYKYKTTLKIRCSQFIFGLIFL